MDATPKELGNHTWEEHVIHVFWEAAYVALPIRWPSYLVVGRNPSSQLRGKNLKLHRDIHFPKHF
jgi:hypothetical protein